MIYSLLIWIPVIELRGLNDDPFDQYDDDETDQQRVFDGRQALNRVGVDLDVNVNFKANSALRDEFDKLCKANHTNMSREIKRYMTAAIRTQRLLK